MRMRIEGEPEGASSVHEMEMIGDVDGAAFIISQRLKAARISFNPLSGAAEIYLKTRDEAWARLVIDSAGDNIRFETKAGGFEHTLELNDPEICILDEGVEIVARNPEIETTLHMSSGGSFLVCSRLLDPVRPQE